MFSRTQNYSCRLPANNAVACFYAVYKFTILILNLKAAP